jgi:hypothetical protein
MNENQQRRQKRGNRPAAGSLVWEEGDCSQAQGAPDLDLDKLEALARAATPGPWQWSNAFQTLDGRENWSLIGADGYGILCCDGIENAPQGIGDQANADFISSRDPAAVLALIALARRATAPHAAQTDPLWIQLGQGKIEIGQGHHGPNGERLPAILFGRNGAGAVGIETEGDRFMEPGECIAAITFENPESLDVVAEKLAELRARIWPDSAQPAPLPERDPSKPAEQQGLFHKFDIRRVDGSDRPGGKHYGCRYYVLDLTHDQHAPAAMRAYAAACRSTHPLLADDIEVEFGTAPTDVAQVAPQPVGALVAKSGSEVDQLVGARYALRWIANGNSDDPAKTAADALMVINSLAPAGVLVAKDKQVQAHVMMPKARRGLDFQCSEGYKAWWNINGVRLRGHSIYSKGSVIWNAALESAAAPAELSVVREAVEAAFEERQGWRVKIAEAVRALATPTTQQGGDQ